MDCSFHQKPHASNNVCEETRKLINIIHLVQRRNVISRDKFNIIRNSRILRLNFFKDNTCKVSIRNNFKRKDKNVYFTGNDVFMRIS